jgi:multidrug efflux pump subunit AcrA (membrane-fusion protein)
MGGGGLVLLKLAPAGSRVKKGDIVAEFDRETQMNRLDDAKANAVQTEANIKALKANLGVAKEAHNQRLRIAKAQLEKAQLDMKTVVVRSAIEAERFKLNLEEAEAQYKQLLGEVRLFDTSQRAQLRTAEIELDQSKIELARAEANVQRMILRAPIDGIVVMQTTHRGGEFGQIREGDQVHSGQAFVQIVDPDSMVINAAVNQVDAEAVRLGMKATVRIDAYPDVQVPAHVVGLAALSRSLGQSRASWAREIPIRLKLDVMDPRIIPDLTGSADIVISTEREAIVAPLETIFREGNRPFVFVRSPAGWLRREVELGPASNTHAVIRAGLQAGSVIAAQVPPMKN